MLLRCWDFISSSHLEASLLELHDGRVVDARALGEDQDRQLVRVLHVVPQSARGTLLNLIRIQNQLNCKEAKTQNFRVLCRGIRTAIKSLARAIPICCNFL